MEKPIPVIQHSCTIYSDLDTSFFKTREEAAFLLLLFISAQPLKNTPLSLCQPAADELFKEMKKEPNSLTALVGLRDGLPVGQPCRQPAVANQIGNHCCCTLIHRRAKSNPP